MRDWESIAPEPLGDRPDRPALRRLRHLRSPQLQNYRDLLVALPPGYEEGNGAYPVVYMQDGQNLFDPATSYAGDWDLLEVLARLADAGRPVIVVGVYHKGTFRRYEYSPFRAAEGGGDGGRYLDFLVETVKPMIDKSFRTRPGPADTLIAGSSMGGLISLYALLERPDIFGAAGALSPSAWFADEALLDHIAGRPASGGRIYLDVGTAEDDRLVTSVRRLRRQLLDSGWRTGADLWYHEDPDGTHHESHWGRRLHDALPFLLGGDPVTEPAEDDA